jgi:hypothetical protein
MSITTSLSPAQVRSSLVAALIDVAGDLGLVVNVYDEAPDALVPPALVATWEHGTPSSEQWGVWSYRFLVECWPATDLVSDGWSQSRDQLLDVALSCIAGSWNPAPGAIQSWEASTSDRQLGGQAFRIAVVLATVIVPAPC